MTNVNKYEQLREELAPFKVMMQRAVEAVLEQEVSKYPILIVSVTPVDLGIPLIDQEESGGSINVHVSTLEELVTKQVIQMEKVDAFIQVYKDPESHICIFYIGPGQAEFLFLPMNIN